MATVTSKRARKATKVVKKMPPKRKPVLVVVPVRLILNPETWQVVGIQKVG